MSAKNVSSGDMIPRSYIDNMIGHELNNTSHDRDTNIDMFCYNKCTNDSDDIIKRCRGIVYDNDSLVMEAFPYTHEISHDCNPEILNDMFKYIDFDKCSMYDSHEGTLIRVFYYKHKWFVSTHKKLDAFKSYWGSNQSFGDIYKSSLDSEYETNDKFRNNIKDPNNTLESNRESLMEIFHDGLDKNHQYMFLLCTNKNNRVVCDSPEIQSLLHVGTFIDGKLNLKHDVCIRRPTQLYFSGQDEMVEYVKSVNLHRTQGVILFTPDNKQYKMVHGYYRELFNIRGNEPNIMFRFLQLRLDPKRLNKLIELYPDNVHMFDIYERVIFNLAKSIHNSYIQRYVKGLWISLPKDEFIIMSKCHSWYKENRPMKITLNKVIDIVNEQSPFHLNRIIIRTIKSNKVQ